MWVYMHIKTDAFVTHVVGVVWRQVNTPAAAMIRIIGLPLLFVRVVYCITVLCWVDP